MKDVLITGSSGFVGQNLLPYLASKGINTIGVSRDTATNESITYNALNNAVWNNAFAMVHLAGKAHDLKGVSSENEYFEVNTELTKIVFNQFLKSNCKVFIYMSSVKAVADEVEGELTEEVDPSPITAYGKSKLAAETYLLSKKLPEGKKLYILRPCMIHGPGNKGNLNLLYQLVSRGIPYPLGAFENIRSFLSVENLCFVIVQLLTKQPQSGVYNIADDKAISTNELVQIIGEGCGKPSKIIKLPKSILLGVGKLGTWLHLPINEEKLQKLTENYVVDTTKILKALGSSLPISTKAGLLKTIQSFQKK